MDNIELRPATASDSEFAYRVKKLAFGKYVDQIWGWDEAEQRRLHQKRFASQQFSIIRWSDADVGILAIVQEEDIVRVNQLFILPEYQCRGIGGACMKRVIDNAAASNSALRLRVLKVNSQARIFFERLGFKTVGETDTHLQMERLT